MFTHPALLRELNQLSELLRRCGEGEWSRRVVQAADELRRRGWTEEGARAVRSLSSGEPSLAQLRLGEEHERFLAGQGGAAAGQARLLRHRERLSELLELPSRAAPPPGPRPKSPDLP